MKIDFTLDFDALLLAAQAKRKLFDDTVDKWRDSYVCKSTKHGWRLDYPPEAKAAVNEAQKSWQEWVKKNIHDRGLELHEDMLGMPVAITAVLASKTML